MKKNKMESAADTITIDGMLENTEAVIFDLDGTLADSMWVWSEIDRDFFRDHHIDFPEYLNREIEGLGFTETAQFFVDNFLLEESVEEIKQLWNDMAIEKYRIKVPLKPGAKAFIARLRQRGVKTGIATSNSMLLVEEFLAAAGIADEIDAITTVCEVSRGKPSPDVYLATARKLNALPERCLVFEDIPMGIRAGKNAGMKVCAVEDEYSAHQREEKRELADYYIEDFTVLTDASDAIDIVSGNRGILCQNVIRQREYGGELIRRQGQESDVSGNYEGV